MLQKIAIVALLGAALLAPHALAAEEGCRFEGQFEKLAALQSNFSLDYFAALRAELEIRRDILRRIIDCSITEAENLKASLLALKTNDADAAEFKSRFSERINEAISYYHLQKARLGDLGIRGTKDAAKSIKEWREGEYGPLSEKVTQFIIWNKNQDLFRIVQNRFEQVSYTVKIFKLVENEEITALFEEAAQNFRKAREMNELARRALREPGFSNDSLTLIKSSLEALAETYRAFFDLSKLVNTLRPPRGVVP